jgi:hypothetical protein
MTSRAFPAMVDDRSVERERFNRMPDRELLLTMVNRTADVYQMIGGISADAAMARAAAERSDKAVSAMQLLAEQIVSARKIPSVPPPPRRRLESLVDVDDADPTIIRDLKAKVAIVAQRDADELAVANKDKERLKTIALVLSVVLAMSAVAGLVWAIFRFAVSQAH